MEDKNDIYIASVKTAYMADNKFLLKEVTQRLIGEPNLTIDGLIEYLIKDDGFSEEEKEMGNAIKGELDASKGNGKYLLIKSIEEDKKEQNNNAASSKHYISFENKDGVETYIIDPNVISKDYFKKRKSNNGKIYFGLDLEICCEKEDGLGLEYLIKK